MSGCVKCRQRPPTGTVDGLCINCEAEALREQVATLARERDALEKSQLFWRERYSEQCALYHDAATERNQALANHAEVARRKTFNEAQQSKIIREIAAERDSLRAIVDASACSTCGGTYRLPWNGSPCSYRWHDMREALAKESA